MNQQIKTEKVLLEMGREITEIKKSIRDIKSWITKQCTIVNPSKSMLDLPRWMKK